MFNALTAIGYGVVAFAIVIGIGTIVLQNLTVATGCPSTYASYNTSTGNCMDLTCTQAIGYPYYNKSYELCANNSGQVVTGNWTGNTSAVPSTTTQITQSLYFLQGKLGQNSGGLASWSPAIIALAIGMLFLGAFLTRKGKQY